MPRPGPALDKRRLGQLIDLVSNSKVGDAESRAKDVIGRVYEYFLTIVVLTDRNDLDDQLFGTVSRGFIPRHPYSK